MTLYLMLLAHLLYDFHWQGPFIAENKGKRPFLLIIHALTWAIFVGLPLYFAKVPLFIPWVCVLFTTHFFIDNWKCQMPKTDEYFWAIYVDQSLHFLSIILVWALGVMK